MALRNITSLIEKENIIQILKESNLAQATKSANPKIVQFFAHHAVDFLGIALKNHHEDDPDFKKLQKGALLVLTSTSSQLQRAIVQIPEFYEELNSFMTLPEFQPKLSGNFCQIINSLSQTNPEENLKPLPQLVSFLINHIDNLAFSELFVTLSVECYSFKVPDEQLQVLTSKCSGPNGLYAIATISSIIKQRPEQYSLFNSLSVIKNFIQSAACHENPSSITASILTLILLIIRKNKEATNVQPRRGMANSSPQELEEIQSKLNDIQQEIEKPETIQLFTHVFENYSVATPIAMLLFNYFNSSLLSLYLQHPMDGIFGVSVFTCFQNVFHTSEDNTIPHNSEKIESTIKILNEIEFLKNLINIFLNHKGAGASMEIAHLFDSLPSEIKGKIEFTNTNEWNEFVSGPLNKRFSLNIENYGDGKMVRQPNIDPQNVSNNQTTSGNLFNNIILEPI